VVLPVLSTKHRQKQFDPWKHHEKPMFAAASSTPKQHGTPGACVAAAAISLHFLLSKTCRRPKKNVTFLLLHSVEARPCHLVSQFSDINGPRFFVLGLEVIHNNS